VTVDQLANYGRKAAALLPTLQVKGPADPVVQVIHEADGEVVYTLRIAGQSFQSKVFAPGRYTIRVSYPESGKVKELKGIEAAAGNQAALTVEV
jgi:hypothetical protein